MPNEAELFFQTDTSIATLRLQHAKSKNANGRPIRPSSAGTKILGILPFVRRDNGVNTELAEKRVKRVVDGEGGNAGGAGRSGVFVAESGGWVRDICLETAETKAIYIGPTAPLTTLAYSAATETLYAGCWDTCIWAWDVSRSVKEGKESKPIGSASSSGSDGGSGGAKGGPAQRIAGHCFSPVSSGHTGFVKTLTLARWSTTGISGKKEILISGGADGAIYVWNTGSGKGITAEGESAKSLKGLDRSVAALAIDPFGGSDDDDDDNAEKQRQGASKQQNDKMVSQTSSPSSLPSVTLFSAGSGISIHRWAISEHPTGLETLPLLPLPPHTHHDSSISALAFDKHGDLWTASTDHTVRHLVRDRDWAVDTKLEHPDVVLDVLVLDMDHPETGRERDCGENEGWVATACRDENVRIWDGMSGTLLYTFTGHYAPVSALCLAADGTRNTLVSVSLDGTIRRWRLNRLREAIRQTERMKDRRNGDGGAVEGKAVAKGAKEHRLKPGTDEWEDESDDDDDDDDVNGKKKKKKKATTPMMTEEEERELEDLMDDDDDDG